MSDTKRVRITRPLYGGTFSTTDGAVTLPFVLRKELVELDADDRFIRLVETAVERVKPRCPHFGICGGCQYQMTSDSEQQNSKRSILYDELLQAGVTIPDPDIPVHGAEPYGYRNRIRLRVERVDGEFRFGYNIRTTTGFLPIAACPIAAPILWETAEALLSLAPQNEGMSAWLSAASEVELFCDESLTRLQLTFSCPPRTSLPRGSFARMMQAVQQIAPQVVGAAGVALDPRTGPTGRVFDTYGEPGLNYRVNLPGQPDETYWVTRGGFFQVNRFLLDTLIQLVCTDSNGQPRRGALAWDLYAGVGLFSRILARGFTQITAVESNPTAAADLRTAFAARQKENAQQKKNSPSPNRTAIQSTMLDFLRSAVLQRDRPELIVLDPPRAGAGVEVCALLAQLAPQTIVYVSCDPITLARDLHALQPHYRIAALHLVDLFPQTFHIETVAILERCSGAGGN